jgi:hypothetical protein
MLAPRLASAGKLMGDRSVRGHRLGVLGCRVGKLWIAVQQRQVTRGTLLVGGGEQVLFGDGSGLRCAVRLLRTRTGQQADGGCQSHQKMRRWTELLHARMHLSLRCNPKRGETMR